MKLKSIGLLSMAITCAMAVSFSISSCDSNKGPVTPGNHSGVDQGKNPQVLGDACQSLIGISNCPNGNASLRYNDDGDVDISNLNTTGNTITSTIDQPANLWHSYVDVTFPSAGGALAYEVKDDAGNTQARVDVKQSGNGYDVYPTFNSNLDGSAALYDAYILNDGAVVGHQLKVSASDVVRMNTDNNPCVVKLSEVRWNVFQANSHCTWKLTFDCCCSLQFQLPDGTLVNGNQVKFMEENNKGFYVYLRTGSVVISGTVANYTAKATSAANTQ